MPLRNGAGMNPAIDPIWSLLLRDAAEALATYRAIMGRDLQGDVLDIGAHAGTFVLSALEAGARHVVAVEASAENCKALAENIGVAGLADRVEILHRAASSRDDEEADLRHAMPDGNT